MIYDCAIIGGGVAGLSAGLVLGRSCRRVAICDAGHPRNAAATAVHCFPGREGTSPAELLRVCRQELAGYPAVTVHTATVADARAVPEGFLVSLEAGPNMVSRSLVLAIGVVDDLPDIPGIRKYFGTSVHVCPYCHGWECRGRPLVVVGATAGAAELARELRIWSQDVTLCTNSEVPMAAPNERTLTKTGISVINGRITRLVGEPPCLEAVLIGDRRIESAALFFKPGQAPRSPLAVNLGCTLSPQGEGVTCGADNKTSVPGVFAAGNIRGGLELAMVAAADGIKAGVAVNEHLLDMDYPRF